MNWIIGLLILKNIGKDTKTMSLYVIEGTLQVKT